MSRVSGLTTRTAVSRLNPRSIPSLLVPSVVSYFSQLRERPSRHSCHFRQGLPRNLRRPNAGKVAYALRSSLKGKIHQLFDLNIKTSCLKFHGVRHLLHLFPVLRDCSQHLCKNFFQPFSSWPNWPIIGSVWPRCVLYISNSSPVDSHSSLQFLHSFPSQLEKTLFLLVAVP